MAFMMALDNWLTDQLVHLAPYKSCHDISSYRSISPNIFITKPVAACLSKGLADGPLRTNVSNERMMKYAA